MKSFKCATNVALKQRLKFYKP